jgi:hypothetical protein
MSVYTIAFYFHQLLFILIDLLLFNFSINKLFISYIAWDNLFPSNTLLIEDEYKKMTILYKNLSHLVSNIVIPLNILWIKKDNLNAIFRLWLTYKCLFFLSNIPLFWKYVTSRVCLSLMCIFDWQIKKSFQVLSLNVRFFFFLNQLSNQYVLDVSTKHYVYKVCPRLISNKGNCSIAILD